MKRGISRYALLLIVCASVLLFPAGHSRAGSVNVPGFHAPVVVPKVAPMQQPGGQSLQIPGFYGPSVGSPSRTQLPVLKQPAVSIPGISGVEHNSSQNQLIIHQEKSQAIIDWSSFDIGADASTHFDQQGNSDWTALNRIWSNSPSLIFGRLTADGKVYLINQNGVLFGPGSRVTVNSLIASALNISSSDFLNGLLSFSVDTGLPFDYEAAISNHGELTASAGGSVFLVGPRVENYGVIDAPAGQVGLAAGSVVALVTDPTGQRRAFIVDVNNFGASGEAWNRAGGELISDSGLIGLYGRVVNHDGLIRSVTAVKQNGQIELRAAEIIRTGMNSIIESPISDSPETVDPSFPFSGGYVMMDGLQTVGSNDTISFVMTKSPPAFVVLKGAIDAPSGWVNVRADQRVFLETGSRIDVGGAWSDEVATANVVATQLNSFELRDAYGQKGGPLQGEEISASILDGSSIGDISRSILSQEKTAQEKGIDGGTVGMTVLQEEGNIIVKQGASLDFSGGGIRYSGGLLDTTKLVSGTHIYDISNAPLTVQYDGIIGQYQKTYERFGIRESYSGIYYGGVSPLKTSTGSFIRGGDAGSLQLAADTIVLDGKLDGSVTRGIFQTQRTPTNTPDYEYALQLSLGQGIEMPRAGTLNIGKTSDASSKAVYEIDVRADKFPLPVDFGADPLMHPLAGKQTVISAKLLNEASLESVNLLANNEITIDSNAHLLLSTGGMFYASGRRIEHSGDITVPSGTIMLITADSVGGATSDFSKNKEIFLLPGSNLNTAGEKVDNSLAGKVPDAVIRAGQVDGGTVILEDQTELGRGVFIADGAAVDVSGGYQIDQKNKITGGNAGALEIRGSTVMLEGDIRGYALADSEGKIEGGQIVVHSGEINLTASQSPWPAEFSPDSVVPDSLRGKFFLAGDFFSETGFTRFEFNSFNDVKIEPTAIISPSLVKQQTPVPGIAQRSGAPLISNPAIGRPVAGQEDLIRLHNELAFETGPSSFKASAGRLFPWQDSLTTLPNKSAALLLSDEAVIHMAPEGKISLSAPGAVTVAGTVESSSGQISITAGTGMKANLVIEESGRILAGGYNRPDMTSAMPTFSYNATPRDGGQVTLQASNGDLLVERGAVIDVSGSHIIENEVLSGGKVESYREAGNAGSLSLTYFGKLDLSGRVRATAKMDEVRGGALTISSADTDLNNGIIVDAEDIGRYLVAGFDDLTLKSLASITFEGTVDITFGRKLTLDAPVLSASGNDVVTLEAPWIVLANSYYPAASASAPGNARLAVSSAGWIDLEGSISLNGFSSVNLEAARDIRFADHYYDALSSPFWKGRLATHGDLILKADRIYPTTRSDYTIRSSNGKVTVLPFDTPAGGPIYSAQGNITVEAATGIEIRGIVAAPLGTITLRGTGADSRVYIAEDSMVTTYSDAIVNYGTVDINNNNFWVVQDKITGIYNPVDISSGKSVFIDAPEIIVRTGATIDISGGGAIFAYEFQPGVEGSVNPLTKTGRFVIMGDRSVQLPGEAVYLSGGAGLSEGMYSLLPIEYAFLPGALVIEERNVSVIPGQNLRTKEGYPLVAGYSAVTGTSIQGIRPKAYAVRPAKDVLSEGHFDMKSQTTGDAGDITVKGRTIIIDGQIHAAALDDYQGGNISLSATDVEVKAITVPLPAEFDFWTRFDSSAELQELQNKLNVVDSSLSGKGFREIELGDATVTENVTVEGGSALEAPVISLTAGNAITVESGATLQALAQTGLGEITFDAPAGLASIHEGATLHASHAIHINAGTQHIQGNMNVDHSDLTLKGVEIFFVSDGYAQTGPGLYVTDTLWNQYSLIENITLAATGYTDPLSRTFIAGEIHFMDSFSGISAVNSLTLDAARIVNSKAHSDSGGRTIQDPINVTLTAPIIHFMNSADTSIAMPNPDGGAGTFTASARNIHIGSGDILFANFESITFNSQNAISTIGKGSLTTGNAGLALHAGLVTTSSEAITVNGLNGTSPITSPKFIFYTGANYYNEQNNLMPSKSITLAASNEVPGEASSSGGVLEFWGTSIDDSGTIDIAGGKIKLIATGSGLSDGIFMRAGSRILAAGDDLKPGGIVTLRTDKGSLVMASDSLIDVSAGAQGDAGTVNLLAPTGGATLDGGLIGTAQGGVGGSLILDTHQISDTVMAHLLGTITAGGFTETLDIQARTGNIEIGAAQTVMARHIILTADDRAQSSGQINIDGTMEGSSGGIIELYAVNDLNILPNGRLAASGADTGGTVLLSSAEGWVNVAGTVDVSGGSGGMISMRASRSSSDVQINLAGTFYGASAVYAEALTTYDDISMIDADIIDSWNLETQDYMFHSPEIRSRLLEKLHGLQADAFHLLPGIEARHDGDITLNANWDLTEWRYGEESGILTIRAAGNLNINNNLVDHPTTISGLTKSPVRDSWEMHLVAGADMSRANALSVNKYGTGTLTVQDQKMVYTESAPLYFASAGDTIIGRSQDIAPGYMINNTMRYNMATYDGTIQGYTGRDLRITGGAIQTATGDISIVVGRDLILSNKQAAGIDTLGTIRTTGETTAITLDGLPDRTQYWTYANGGNISLDVGGHVGNKTTVGWIPAMNDNAWDWAYGSRQPYVWAPSYETIGNTYGSTAGIVTMGGGNVEVYTEGDFLSQTGTFGNGDLTVYAGGDIRGRFLNRQGKVEIHAGGNFGKVGAEQVIEAFDSRIDITSQGNMNIGAVVNPTIARQRFAGQYWNLTYTENTSLRLQAGGDITMTGKSPFYNLSSSLDINQRVLPSTVEMEAGGDITFMNDFALTPSRLGTLRLIAGGDIDGYSTTTQGGVISAKRSSIYVSDMEPLDVYASFLFSGLSGSFADRLFNPYEHANVPLHSGDTDAVEVHAGRDIRDLKFFLPKKAEIRAGRDIHDIYYFGQNLNTEDVSEIQAGRDFTLSYLLNDYQTGLWQAGPGVLLLQAGNSIDLGSSHGVQSIGNQFNSVIGTEGSSLIVLSGHSSENVDVSLDEASAFFSELRDEGSLYSLLRGGAEDRDQAALIIDGITTEVAETFIQKLRHDSGNEDAFYEKIMAGGNNQEAEELIEMARAGTIEPLLGISVNTEGDINMTSTQISANYGKSDIFIFANGVMNVGKSTFFSSESEVQNTGILTSSGGSINIFSNGDVNVNESRVMTFLGGDITVWSDQGNINAGRGSKSAINPSVPRRILIGRVGDRDIYVIAFSPPAVGSGIRGVTYDPDGVAGPLQPPSPGDIYLFAARGTIDAGEAGIAGGKVILGATQVLNVQNISFAAGSVGVPVTTDGTAGIGTLSGTGTVAAQNSQLMSDASSIASTSAAQAARLIDDIMTKWLDVKVIEFSEETMEESKEE